MKPGISEAQLLAAIEGSGYPLQTAAAAILQPAFSIQEEWSYVDRDSGDLRSLDILARRELFDLRIGPELRVRPELNLLVECKQSQLPYVFFLTGETPWSAELPLIAGLHEDCICITTDDDLSSWTMPVCHALGLDDDPFRRQPVCCKTFSKCVRKGSEIELSGSEAYSGLVLPLIKALEHFVTSERPPKTALYFDLHMAIGVGVLDAPMVAIRADDPTGSLHALPWVRVLRHEYCDEPAAVRRERLWALDVVHKDFFADYVEKQALPFAKRFATVVQKHEVVVAEGAAFASGMGADSWTDIEPRLQPARFRRKMSRWAAMVRNVPSILGR